MCTYMYVTSSLSTKSHVERLPETLLTLGLMGVTKNPTYIGSEAGELHTQDQPGLVSEFVTSAGSLGILCLKKINIKKWLAM